MDISIIIPSYNSERTIDRCLQSLAAQKPGRLEYEIVLVDSSPGISVNNIAQKYPAVKIIKLQKKTLPGIARNIGAKEAQGELLIFVDSDIILQQGWLEGAFAYYKSGHDIFSGSIGIYAGGRIRFIDTLAWYFECSEYKPQMKEGERWCLSCCAFGIRKSIFEKEKFLDMESSEDVELTVRLRLKGNILYFNPRLKAIHIFSENISKLLRKACDFGVTNMSIRKMYKVSGSSLVNRKMPGFIAIPIFAIIKLIKISRRNMLYNDLGDRALYIFMLPLMAIVIFSWMIGAYKIFFIPAETGQRGNTA